LEAARWLFPRRRTLDLCPPKAAAVGGTATLQSGAVRSGIKRDTFRSIACKHVWLRHDMMGLLALR